MANLLANRLPVQLSTPLLASQGVSETLKGDDRSEHVPRISIKASYTVEHKREIRVISSILQPFSELLLAAVGFQTSNTESACEPV